MAIHVGDILKIPVAGFKHFVEKISLFETESRKHDRTADSDQDQRFDCGSRQPA
jgi:hypothetical protein